MRDSEAAPLLVLTADLQMQTVIETLLEERQRDLGTEVTANEVRRHPRSDPGCRVWAVEHVRPVLRDFGRLLVIFDYDGCGSTDEPEEIEKAVEDDLAKNGWKDRSKVIVIVPELEAWIWGRSEGAARALGWYRGFPALRNWLREEALWPSGASKPPDPKRAAERVLKRNNRPISADFYRDLTRTADLRNCRDRAFCSLRDTLREWYPAAPRVN